MTTSTGYHHLPLDALYAQLQTTPAGLTHGEAAIRLARYGANRLPEGRRKTPLGVFLAQFRSPFIYLLLAAGGISLWLGARADAAFIFIVLLLNAMIGTYQEWRAETRSRSLRAMIKGTATVRRDGQWIRVPSEQLVPGDLVQVASGDRMAADVRLIDAQNLLLDESLLTGESNAVYKRAEDEVAADAALGDRTTLLHAGTTVQTGRGTGIVVATGARTEVGRLARALDRPEPPPPLVRRMTVFTRHVAVAILGVILLISVLELGRGAAVGDIFVLAIALMVSAIPEGLPVAMTVALSIAMHRMGLRNVVVRHLPAVEGLGACTTIATDKTGTLTLNVMTVMRAWLPGQGALEPRDPRARQLLTAAARASERPAGDVGDAVDLAFMDAAANHDWHPDAGDALLVGRVPYEPEKRFAAVFHRDCGGDGLVACVKGAPETIMELCTQVDESARHAARQLTSDGYRVIAVASGVTARSEESALRGLRLLGFAGLIDPLRPEARQAIRDARQAGVRVVMITGDHPLTAMAIARDLDLAHDPGEVTTGAELAQLHGAALDAAVARARVFARTEPLQKLAIVESLRRQGEIVAVTGDGVNDAPALHVADIGVAMGRGGTDVARDASDLILTDDNFASIVAGIEEGRVAYDNLRKVILLLISTAVAEILLVLMATLVGLPPPLTAVQLLWLNLVTNGMQDVALAFERGEGDVLRRPPRPANSPIFDRRMIEQVLLGGLVIGAISFGFYYVAVTTGMAHATAQGAVLWLLVWCENAQVFNCRSETRSVFTIPPRHNPLLIAAVAGTQLLQIAVLAIPSMRDLLSLQGLSVTDGISLAVASLGVLAAMEGYKWLRRRHPHHARTAGRGKRRPGK
ncbi:MAG: cation-translocating P-type ATPase [Pseudomonadota bacterium]